MKSLLLLIIVFTAATCKTKVDLYVESLCPDCMDFLTSSFDNFLNQPDHADLADVTIYPYGNAHETEQAGTYTFTCQHGPNECYGNSYYECANVLLTKKYGNTENAKKFIVCMEANVVKHGKNFDFAAYHCLQDIPQDLSLLQLCVQDSKVSNPLMHLVAQKTDSLVPKHTYVPWIVVDDKHDVDVENKIIADMYGYLKGLKEKANLK